MKFTFAFLVYFVLNLLQKPVETRKFSCVWLNYSLGNLEVNTGDEVYTEVSWRVDLESRSEMSLFLSECLRRLVIRLGDSLDSESIKLLDRYTEDLIEKRIQGMVRFYVNHETSYRISLVYGLNGKMGQNKEELAIITMIKYGNDMNHEEIRINKCVRLFVSNYFCYFCFGLFGILFNYF